MTDEPDWLVEQRREALLEIARSDSAPPADDVQGAGPLATGSPANLPASFYDARPEYAHIRNAAHSRAISADALLFTILARLSANVPPWHRLPAVVGGVGTLDLCVAHIGASGTGKSVSSRVGAELLPLRDDTIGEANPSSGEGLIEAYFDLVDEEGDDGKKRRVKRQVRNGMLFHLDEGQALSEMGSRKGSTLLPTIRSAWSGAELGQANAAEERKRRIKDYRFALIAAFQLEYASALLDDAAGGTPQRFLYASAVDPTVPDIAPAWPGPLPWSLSPRAAGTLDLDPTIANEIRARALGRTRGEISIDPLDAHRDLSRLKVAGLLAILDRRWDITPDDWALSGQVLDVSDRVRAGIIAAAAHRAAIAEKASVDKHVRRSDAAEQSAERRAVEAMTKAVARHVHKASCSGGCQRRCVSRATPGKYRAVFSVDDALSEAASRGWISVDGDTISPGETRPA